MEKHLLLTVSEQLNHMHAVRFSGKFLKGMKNISFTLFYTTPRPPALSIEEKTVQDVSLNDQLAKQYEGKGRRALDTAKKELLQLGFAPERVKTKLRARKFSKAVDIIQEGERGLYDAVILGRRGLSRLEEAFDESISRQVFEQKVPFPVWICRKPDPNRKNVLLCVDGSDASMRAVDHTGFILKGVEDHHVTLFAVSGSGNIGGKDTEAVFSKCESILIEYGCEKERIHVAEVSGSNIAKTILKHAEQKKYAAVAVGRRRGKQGFIEKVMKGSVTKTLFQELTGSALWICS